MGNTQKELLERYKTWMNIQRRNNKRTIKAMMFSSRKFLAWLDKKNIKVEEINQDVVDQYLAYCYTKFSQNTMVVITANLRKLLLHFLKMNLDIKVAKPIAPERDKVSLTKEEIKEMFRCASSNPLELAVIKTLYYTGVRNTELTNLNLSDVDFNRLQVTIKHGKGNKLRVVNMTEDCALALQRWIQVRPKPLPDHEEALFVSSCKQRITSACVGKIVKRTAARADIKKHVYPHKLRITNITHMAEAGLSISEIQAQSGHSNTQTLLGYIQHTPSRIRKGYDRTFQNVTDTNLNTDSTMPSVMSDNESYKKMAIKKYLDGELDNDALHAILRTLDTDKPVDKKLDLAYQ